MAYFTINDNLYFKIFYIKNYFKENTDYAFYIGFVRVYKIITIFFKIIFM